MAIYTATLSAQNTNVYVCDIKRPRAFKTWYANVSGTGTFGTGTVTYNISYDNGATLIPLTQAGTSTAATQTAAGAINLECGGESSRNSQPAKLYASIATATNPSLTITVYDNN